MADTETLLPELLGGWLERATADPANAGPMPDPIELVREMTSTNPAMAAMLQLLEARRARAAETDDLDDLDIDLDHLNLDRDVGGGVHPYASRSIDVSAQVWPTDEPDAGARRAAALELLHGLLDELDVRRRRERMLAQALGACPVCWGDDEQCAACDGFGRPGNTTPHAGAFRFWITPAVRALPRPPDPRAIKQPRHQATTPTNHEGATP